ncbi:hypothetical protein [Desulfococcus multivorans]|uniref:Uncharacterized protein n=1 Tax=Desulfococcus multivorans DSM 2059 TaxID=1121405 RepID=S7UPF3_DESML|nr:hypothetical protein [Desulfococcus multivorans]AOY59542.1 uncharacterized protein Dmul_27700 [Desulfococcus multivorans]AQV01737.1 hypothetical protein B2D07_13840 [Desulfococcus multivorans]EPR34188.1 hypothetical protein dsmv_3400 [Desulfococcus multivorans DSM 2059]SKA19914.1 hypothetical protein SAMN02745446_03226 [Desulfococcus multivorans DSM 2059]
MMKPDKKYQKISGELARAVQAELNYRIGSTPKSIDLAELGDIFEHRNRQIVTAHQNDAVADILYPIFVTYLQSREGGKLHLFPDSVSPEIFSEYIKKKERFETLFTAAIMGLKDTELLDIINGVRAIFEEQHQKLKGINRLADTVRHIRRTVADIAEKPSGSEKHAIEFLMQLAPLNADLRAIESGCVEFRESPCLKAAIQHLENELRNADRVIAEKGRKASKLLIDNAGAIFHTYTVTPVSLSNTESFIAQKAAIVRYAKIFGSIGDTERRETLEKFISAIDVTLQKLRQEIEKQKEGEALLAEKHQQEINDAYERFLEIKNLFADGRLTLESQQKNAAEKLRKCRDILIANGQRVMARDIDRFINSAGIGKSAPSSNPDAGTDDAFDYRKGFLILLPISVMLFFAVLLFLIL